MSYVAVAVGGSAVLNLAGGLISSSAASDAADAQTAATGEANKMQWDMYQQIRADQEPWRKAGASALTGLQDADFQRDFTAGDFQKDPGYDFRMSEGQRALERSAAARGGLQSGGTMKALSRYGQDYASNEYNNAYNRFNADRDRRFNRLSSITSFGQTANSQIGAAGQNYANTVGSNLTNLGNAQGAAKMAQANAWGNALSGVGKVGMDYAAGRWMDQSLSRMGGNAAIPSADSFAYNSKYFGKIW